MYDASEGDEVLQKLENTLAEVGSSSLIEAAGCKGLAGHYKCNH